MTYRASPLAPAALPRRTPWWRLARAWADGTLRRLEERGRLRRLDAKIAADKRRGFIGTIKLERRVISAPDAAIRVTEIVRVHELTGWVEQINDTTRRS